MTGTKTKGEMHGCIVCGKLYQLLVVYDLEGNFIGSKVMSAGGQAVKYEKRPLVACEKHTEKEIERAIKRVFGDQVPELE
jgi:succinate dehydrogenase/fumarate reductase-like Fe-S protein